MRGVLKDKQKSETDVNEQISLRVVPLDMPQHAPVLQPYIQGHTSTSPETSANRSLIKQH